MYGTSVVYSTSAHYKNVRGQLVTYSQKKRLVCNSEYPLYGGTATTGRRLYGSVGAAGYFDRYGN
jgi:hypothetical protein